MSTSPPDLAEIAARLERLEARVLSGTLETGRLRILGPHGRPVAEIGASPDGEPEVVLLDALGRDRILLRLVEGECALEMLGEDGRPRLRAAASDATSRLVLWTESGVPRRAELRAASDGTAVMAVVEGRDAVRATFGVGATGEGVVRCEPAPRTEGGTP